MNRSGHRPFRLRDFTAQQQVFLRALAGATHGKPMSLDRLIPALWSPKWEPEAPENSIRVIAWHIRRRLIGTGVVLRSWGIGGGYYLDGPAGAL